LGEPSVERLTSTLKI